MKKMVGELAETVVPVLYVQVFVQEQEYVQEFDLRKVSCHPPHQDFEIHACVWKALVSRASKVNVKGTNLYLKASHKLGTVGTSVSNKKYDSFDTRTGY